jgi:hypothetical protein
LIICFEQGKHHLTRREIIVYRLQKRGKGDIMKKVLISLLAIGLIFNIFLTSNVFAQEDTKRVIEESLVLKDPTVTGMGKWVIGGALEYWYIKGSYDVYDGNGVKQATGDMQGGMPGGNIFFGYGDFTLNYAFRKGSFSGDFNYNSGMNTHDEQDQKEHEVTLRWLMRGLSLPHFTPYLVAGYTQIDLNETETITTTTPNWVWSYNHLKVKSSTTTYKSPLVGIGAIVPVNEYFGVRLDGRVLYTSATRTFETGLEYTGSGVGGSLIATAYVNIWEGLNFQVGGKYLALNGGDAGSYSKVGGFAMLGYSYKF